ncbi:hypothetical protein [Cryptosporangium japonicum]|uniref:hypothetical protein n=1 Tax=Cryptosporangium japonicum TaxID=80872 RepID=UPI0031E1B0FF
MEKSSERAGSAGPAGPLAGSADALVAPPGAVVAPPGAFGLSPGAFAVSPGALVDAGRVASALVDELDAIRRHWRSGTADVAGATGLREADHAIADTVQRWDAELGLYLEVLRTLCDALPIAAAGYRDADGATVSGEAE